MWSDQLNQYFCMWLYAPTHRNIARSFFLALASACLIFSSRASSDDADWYSRSLSQSFDDRGKPPVSLFDTHTADNFLTTTVHAKPERLDGNTIAFVMAAPAGKITSATLTIDALTTPTDSAAILDPPVYLHEIPVITKDIGYVRGHRLVKVSFPASVPGLAGREFYRGQMTLAFAPGSLSPSSQTGQPTQSSPNFISDMVKRLVANPTDVDRFQLPLTEIPEPIDNQPSPPLGSYTSTVAGFSSAEAGFAQFTGADLAACGVDIGRTSPDAVTLWSDGVQIPMRVTSTNSQHVSPSDQFLLYARDSASTYTLRREYRICLGAGKPLRLQTENNPLPASLHPSDSYFITRKLIEQDTPPVVTKNDQFLSILDFRWVWWTWSAEPSPAIPGGKTFQQPGMVQFNADGLTSSPQSATIKLHFYTHHWAAEAAPVPIKVDLNGSNIGLANVAEGSSLTHTFSVSTDKIRSTSNTLTLTPQTTTTTGLPDICFDRLELDYPRSYTMTSDTLRFRAPATPTHHITLTPDALTTGIIIADVSSTPRILAETTDASPVSIPISTAPSGEYVAAASSSIRRLELLPVPHTTDLHSAENQADLVVIAWPDFMEDMEPWADHKQAAGHKVRIIDVRDIYEQFGYGSPSPHAIRAFLRHAAIHWKGSSKGPAASSILLVGDSTSAYRNEFRNDVINYVPTMRITNTSDPYASDQWYVSSFGNDFLADSLIGRFSVNNKEDLRRIITRQLAYESASPAGPWQNTLGFVADHSEFAPAVERVIQKAVPPRFFLKKVLMDDLPWIDNYYFPKELADARQAKVSQEATVRIRDIFNQGAAVVTYFGHGSPNIWGNERMWFGGDSPNSDNLLLTNADRLPLVINMTCNSGAIDYPQPRWNVCISEDFMRAANGGAIACFVPSGPGLTVQHERLMMEIGWLLLNDNSLTLGQNLQLALWKYIADDNPPELARMFILLGDPLVQLKLAQPATVDLATSGTNRFRQTIAYNNSTEPAAIEPWAPQVSPSAPEHSTGIAISADGNSSGTVQSMASPAHPLRSMQLIHWQQSPASSADASSTTSTTITFRLRNNAPLPARSVHVEVSGNNQIVGKSPTLDVMPFAELTFPVVIQVPPGFTPLEAWLVNGQDRIPLVHETPIAVTHLRPDNQRETIPPALVDPRSISVRYREVGGSIMATINAQVYMLAREPLSNLRIALEGPDGQLVPKSEIAIPPVSPGGSARVTVSADVTSQIAALYRLRFDPTGLYPEFRRWPGSQVSLGHSVYGDIVVEQVDVKPESPTDGETIFLDVTLRNRGQATVDGVKVEATRFTDANTREALKSQPYKEPQLLNLDPGTSKSIRLRWDPFRNAGENRLQVSAVSVYNSPDANPDDNAKSVTVRVKTKADIRSEGVGWLPLTEQDRAARQVRFVAKVRNHGETPAYGLKVSFYSEKSRAPETYLGDVDLDVVEPGETREAIYTYKPKAGEENKAFHITCEIMFKGSRQRTPLN